MSQGKVLSLLLISKTLHALVQIQYARVSFYRQNHHNTELGQCSSAYNKEDDTYRLYKEDDTYGLYSIQESNAPQQHCPCHVQESIYSAEKDVQQMSSRVQRELEDLQRRAAVLADTALKQEAEAQRLQLERRSWQDGQAERSQLEAAARESKQQAQHLKVNALSPFLCKY